MFNKTLKIDRIHFDPKKVAMSCDLGDSEWVDMDFGELKEIVDEVSKILMMIGVKKGDRIILFGENHFKWLPVFLGIAGYGAIVVPIDGVIADSRMLSLFDDCQPSAIVVSKKFQDRLLNVAKGFAKPCNIVNFHFDLLKIYDQIKPTEAHPPAPEPEDIAAIIYTSGTTGKPKGVMLSHRALVEAVNLGAKIGSVDEKDVFLAILPFTHVFGLVVAGLVPLAAGSRIVLAGTFNPIELFGAIKKYHVSNILAVPRLADVFAATFRQNNIQMPGLKVVVGGASCNIKTLEVLRSCGITAYQGYGMTETSGGVVATADAPLQSVGRPFPEVEFKIDNPQNGVGELLIASPTLLSGFYNDPENSKNAFAGKYFRTGDLGEINSDGFLFLKGRVKEVIIPPGGVNVYPDELEMRLGHLPWADEYAVIGLKEGDYEYPIIVLKPKVEFFQQNKIEDQDKYATEELEGKIADWPDWERFRRVILMNSPLPRSASQKIQRNLLETLIQKQISKPLEVVSDAGEAMESPNVFSKFQYIVGHFLNVFPEEIRPDRKLTEFLQLDSLGTIALVARIEEVFRVSLKKIQQEDLNSFGTLYSVVLRNSPEDIESREIFPEDLPILPPLLDSSREAVKRRQQFLQTLIKDTIKVIPLPEEPELFNGNIEGFLGFSQVPLGITGPLRVNGAHAKGEFFLPLATTEGALVASISRGAQVITAAGGANTLVVADSLVRAPIFLFEKLEEMMEFSKWLKENFDAVKAAAETTTSHGKLETIEEFFMGSNLCLRFVYSTGDASGQNMTTIATHKALDYIQKNYHGKFKDFFLESNLSGDKKVNAVNYSRNRGKKVVAEVEIPREIVAKLLHTTPERMVKLTEISMMTALHAHSFGSQAHFANLLAAIFIATGQDPACVAESAVGVTQVYMKGENLGVSITIPGLMVGTVGGGTRLPTQRACLQILDCYGPRKAKKFAEIVAAGVLAAEISLIGAMAADEFASAHAKYGRSTGPVKKD